MDAYARAKRDVEAKAKDLEATGRDVVIARLFTCLGHGYRAHGHLAHVSMLDDARAGRPIVVRSDGSAIRSFFFGADLALWLLALLTARGNDTVNIGSDEGMSLLDFARKVAQVAGRGEDTVQVLGVEPTVRPYFVPDISHARSRYVVVPWINVQTAIAQSLRGG